MSVVFIGAKDLFLKKKYRDSMEGQLSSRFNRGDIIAVSHHSACGTVSLAPLFGCERQPLVLRVPNPERVLRELLPSFSSLSRPKSSGSLTRSQFKSEADAKRTHVRARLINAIAELLVADPVRYFK